ncbi:MAG: SoxR reducing system RseC family protein [Deferribacterales bacterium]
MSERFENIGKVVKVYKNGYVDILVQQLTACGSCHAQCSMAGGAKEKLFHIKTDLNLSENEPVKLVIENTNLRRSAILVYLIPILIVVAVAVLLDNIGVKDFYVALSSIIVIVCYFLILKIFGKRIDNNIIIEKIEV